MENNTTSRSSICWKIRQALATNPAFRVIHHRIKHYYQEPRPATAHSNSPSLTPNLPQNMMKAKNTKGEGEIPIKFDNSIPISTPRVHVQVSKVASPQVGISAKIEPEPEPWHVQGSRVGLFKDEHNNGKDTITGPLKEQHGLGMQQGKKTVVDINDTFTEYIERARHRIRTVSNVGRGQSHSVSDETSGNKNNKMENHTDQFSDFIQHSKKKMRTTTSNVGKTSTLKRGYKS